MTTLTPDERDRINAYWRAANYLSVGQIYLRDNPLLREPLKREHIKPRLLGHFGTTPGLNFIYAHCNRVIKARDLNMMYVIGPGHGGPGIVANAYLEGTYTEIYSHITQDERGLQRLFKQFSFPGGIPSHVSPDCPGSIHEGGELGYSLSHAHGAAFDNPDLIVTCVIGDGEAETGPLAASWHSIKFVNPARDGAVLPILHLNGYKIANPTILGRMSDHDLTQFFTGMGYHVFIVQGDRPEQMHEDMAATMDKVCDTIKAIQFHSRLNSGADEMTMIGGWPLIILRSHKGWTGPKTVDGKKVEGFWRAHQVPIPDMKTDAHIALLEEWMRSYKPEELFDETGALKAEIAGLAPTGTRRMSANPHTNGGLLLRDLELPDFRDYAVEVKRPAHAEAEATRELGKFLRDVMKANEQSANFRVLGPDEVDSNRLSAVFEETSRVWMEPIYEYDEHLAPSGRVMEILSEHTCQGWLEGYLLTGQHGLFTCYEAFIHIVDSMV